MLGKTFSKKKERNQWNPVKQISEKQTSEIRDKDMNFANTSIHNLI